MTKKNSQADFIEILKKKTGCQSDEAFGELFGVTKQSVSHWKSGKGQIPFDRFLRNFGKETLEWIKQEYGLEDNHDTASCEDTQRYEQVGRLVFAIAEIMGQKFNKEPEPKKDADPGDEMIARLMKQVDSISHAGPPPELTDEEFERLVRLRRGYYRRDDD